MKENILHSEKAHIPTKYGDFELIAYAVDAKDRMPQVVLRHKDIDTSKPVWVRMHSECLTGDIFHSKRCDCGAQLDKSLKLISENKGLLIYLRQEGRGIGLFNKLKAYNLQDEGYDTFEANAHLGLDTDAREYDVALQIMKDMGIKKINLLTNNPEKIKAFENSDIEIVDRIPVSIPANETNQKYLETKRDVGGHLWNAE